MCGCLSHTPNWAPGLQPRHVPWLGIKPATLWFTGQRPIHWATPAGAIKYFSSLLMATQNSHIIYSVNHTLVAGYFMLFIVTYLTNAELTKLTHIFVRIPNYFIGEIPKSGNSGWKSSSRLKVFDLMSLFQRLCFLIHPPTVYVLPIHLLLPACFSLDLHSLSLLLRRALYILGR